MKKLFFLSLLTLLFGFSLAQAQVTDPVSILAAGGIPPFIGTTDLDNDGDGDLVIVFYNVDSVVTMMGNGAGGFGTRRAKGVAPYAPANVQMTGADFADFNNDGFMDIVVSSLGSNHALIYWGNGNDTLSLPIAGSGSGSYAVAAGYFDQDLNADFAILLNTASGVDSIRYWFGNGINKKKEIFLLF